MGGGGSGGKKGMRRRGGGGGGEEKGNQGKMSGGAEAERKSGGEEREGGGGAGTLWSNEASGRKRLTFSCLVNRWDRAGRVREGPFPLLSMTFLHNAANYNKKNISFSPLLGQKVGDFDKLFFSFCEL